MQPSWNDIIVLLYYRMGCTLSKSSTPVEDIRGQQPYLDAPQAWVARKDKKEKMRRPLTAHYKRRKNRVRKFHKLQKKDRLLAFLKRSCSPAWLLTAGSLHKETATLPRSNSASRIAANTQEFFHMHAPPEETQMVDLTDLQNIADGLSVIELDVSQDIVPASGQTEEELSLVALKYLNLFDLQDFEPEEDMEGEIELPGLP